MKTLFAAILAVLLLCLPAAGRSVSGQSGVYAVVERIVLEPASGPPERIQVWGAFALMERMREGFTSYVYRKPVRGYMYFRLPPERPEVGASPDVENARKEWRDFATIAGTKQAVAFGYWDQYRGDSMPTVRTAEAKPVNPDPYLMDVGVVKLGPGSPGGVVDELLKLANVR
jgi:hypothetical protein